MPWQQLLLQASLPLTLRLDFVSMFIQLTFTLDIGVGLALGVVDLDFSATISGKGKTLFRNHTRP